MFGSSDSMLARQVINVINATGIKVPAAVTDTWEQVELLSTAGRQLSPGDVSPAVAEAILAGRDPAADPEVQRMVTAQQIAGEGMMRSLDAIGYERFRGACLEHADTIVTAWRKPFGQAAATLTAAHDRIGDIPLEDTASIMQRGSDIAAVWATAQAAGKVIDIITTGWVALGNFTRTVSDSRNYQVLRLAGCDYAAWQAKELQGKRLTPWELLCAGLSPSLPTALEFRQRVAAITQQAQAEAQTGEVDSLRSAIAGREIRSAVG